MRSGIVELPKVTCVLDPPGAYPPTMTVEGRTIVLEVVGRPPVKQIPADAAERARQKQSNLVFGQAFVAADPSWPMFVLAINRAVDRVRASRRPLGQRQHHRRASPTSSNDATPTTTTVSSDE